MLAGSDGNKSPSWLDGSAENRLLPLIPLAKSIVLPGAVVKAEAALRKRRANKEALGTIFSFSANRHSGQK